MQDLLYFEVDSFYVGKGQIWPLLMMFRGFWPYLVIAVCGPTVCLVFLLESTESCISKLVSALIFMATWKQTEL